MIQELFAERPVITDGAWGTQLQLRGLAAGACPDALNLSHPEIVEQVAAAYVEAGSRVILTNTFRANRLSLAGYGLAAQTRDINRAGVALSREAAAGRALVFASIGPSGKMLVSEETTEEELRDVFGEQARALAEGGADALLIETMADLAEARLALAAARETGLPVVVSMVFDTGRNKDRTMTGVTPEQAAAELEAAGADVIGANCGCGVSGYVSICRRLHAATTRPIWIKPNAGLPDLVSGEAIYRMTAEEFAGYLPAMLEAGATFIGGCCGTTPEFIRALRTAARCV